MADLRVRDFPDDLLRKAKSEADLDGRYLRDLVIEAVREKVARTQQERAEREAATG